MDPPSCDATKHPDMVSFHQHQKHLLKYQFLNMCGDHPSYTKTELNVKEVKPEGKDKPRERTPVTYARISPTSSRTGTEHGVSAVSEHGVRALQARRRVRSLEAVPRADADAPDSRSMLQAAMGSFRWPPYLLCVWVCVLVLTHALHALAALLERTLPSIKRFGQYLRTWTEDSWKSDSDINHRVCPIALACATGALYAIYGLLYGLHAAAIWAIEPLCPEESTDVVNVTNYVDDDASKTNASVKH